MAPVLLDTSAVYALADRADPNHTAALQRLPRLLPLVWGIRGLPP